MCDVKQPRHQAAMWFDGVDNAVKATIVPPSGDLTIIAVIRTSIRLRQAFLSVGQTVTGAAFTLESGRFGTGIPAVSWHGNQNFCYGLSPIADNQWHILCGIGRESVVEFYVDGVFQQSVVTVRGALGKAFRVGTYVGEGLPASGNIIECYVFHTALASIEVQNITFFGNRLQGIITPPYIYWRGDGNTNEAWQDRSGNGNHGTVYGSPEQCLIHRRGAVIRTDANHQRYIVT